MKLNAPLALCPQAWPISGKASYSASIPIFISEFKSSSSVIVSSADELYKAGVELNTGIKELLFAVWELLENTEVNYDSFDDEYYVEEADVKDEIIVRKENGMYIVEGDFMERLLDSTYVDNEESLRYFQEMLKRKGVIEELKALGIREGESVFICDYEFEFFD